MQYSVLFSRWTMKSSFPFPVPQATGLQPLQIYFQKIVFSIEFGTIYRIAIGIYVLFSLLNFHGVFITLFCIPEYPGIDCNQYCIYSSLYFLKFD